MDDLEWWRQERMAIRKRAVAELNGRGMVKVTDSAEEVKVGQLLGSDEQGFTIALADDAASQLVYLYGEIEWVEPADEMDLLVWWLRQQLDYDERVARDAFAEMVENPDPAAYLAPKAPAAKAHILLHGPNRVLNEVEATRWMVTVCETAFKDKANPEMMRSSEASDLIDFNVSLADCAPLAERVLCCLAKRYDDRPGFRRQWRA